LQRSLQKGRKGLLGANSDKLLQLGQGTKRILVVTIDVYKYELFNDF
jgi:hypothetical protein